MFYNASCTELLIEEYSGNFQVARLHTMVAAAAAGISSTSYISYWHCLGCSTCDMQLC